MCVDASPAGRNLKIEKLKIRTKNNGRQPKFFINIYDFIKGGLKTNYRRDNERVTN